jgi:hypothetical protein
MRQKNSLRNSLTEGIFRNRPSAKGALRRGMPKPNGGLGVVSSNPAAPTNQPLDFCRSSLVDQGRH